MNFTESKFYVYRHIRLDTNEVFYVGKGFGKRAWETLTDQLRGRAKKRTNLMYLSEYEKLNNKE